jgi:activator of HSP90 ATPase
MDHWNTGPAQMDPQVGGQFSLYDGDVHGTNTEIVPNQLLRQDWYGDDHPKRKYDVTFTLEPVDSRTTWVTVTHQAGEDDIESMRSGWREYYFNPIKQLLEKHASTSITLKLIAYLRQHL